MSYNYAIKASGINNLTNARFFSSQLVDWIGLDLDPLSPDNLNKRNAQEIVHWLVGVQLVGEFDNRDAAEVMFLANELNLKAVEVPYGMDIPMNDVTVFSRLALDEGTIPMALDPGNADHLVLQLHDTHDIGDLPSDVFEVIKSACEEHSVFLGANFTGENIPHFLQAFQPAGINLSPGDEMGLGMNDFDEVKEILSQLSE